MSSIFGERKEGKKLARNWFPSPEWQLGGEERGGEGGKNRANEGNVYPLGGGRGERGARFRFAARQQFEGGVSPTSYVLVACMYAWTTAVGRHFIRDFIHSEFLAKVKDNRHRPVSLLRHPALKRA